MRISDWSSDVCSSDLARGLLEVQALAGCLHRAVELVAKFVAATFEEQRHPAHRFGVLARLHQAHAGRGAAADLVLQAGPRAVAEHADLAAAQTEHLVHQVARPTHRPDSRELDKTSSTENTRHDW